MIYFMMKKRHSKKTLERDFERKNVQTVLDVSIGTGNQTLPLAEMGIALYGSDLSEEMLKNVKLRLIMKD